MCDGRTDTPMIRSISVAEVFRSSDAARLFSEYAAECSIPLIGEINPQQITYEAIERTGMLKCFGAYEGERLVGFATVLTTVLPHYNKKVATMESLFVEPESRAGGIGDELLKAVETFAKKDGCVAILYSAPAGGRLERLLQRKYTKTNAVFCRSL
jgi:GNAT superfamily N-acetyltransferase